MVDIFVYVWLELGLKDQDQAGEGVVVLGVWGGNMGYMALVEVEKVGMEGLMGEGESWGELLEIVVGMG